MWLFLRVLLMLCLRCARVPQRMDECCLCALLSCLAHRSSVVRLCALLASPALPLSFLLFPVLIFSSLVFTCCCLAHPGFYAARSFVPFRLSQSKEPAYTSFQPPGIPGKRPPDAVMDIPPNVVGWVIGKAGMRINDLQARTSASVR